MTPTRVLGIFKVPLSKKHTDYSEIGSYYPLGYSFPSDYSVQLLYAITALAVMKAKLNPLLYCKREEFFEGDPREFCMFKRILNIIYIIIIRSVDIKENMC